MKLSRIAKLAGLGLICLCLTGCGVSKSAAGDWEVFIGTVRNPNK